MVETVVLTQAAVRAAALAARLEALGVGAVRWPLTGVAPASGVDWPALAGALGGCRWVLLPSPGAIDVVMGALDAHGLRWPAEAGVGVVGPGSAEVLDDWRDRLPGLAEARVLAPPGPRHDADALLAAPELAALAGVGVAVLRRADGARTWRRVLDERGASVLDVVAYAAHELPPPPGAADRLAAWRDRDARVAFSFASVAAGGRLARFVAGHDAGPWVLGRPALAQHPRIVEALRAQGWRRVLGHPVGADGLIAALESIGDT